MNPTLFTCTTRHTGEPVEKVRPGTIHPAAISLRATS